MKSKITFLALCLFLFSPIAFAVDAVVDLPADQFFAQIAELISNWGGLGWLAKVSTIILVIVASFKVSFIRPLWDKLGRAKAYVAPVLGIIGGVLSLHPITWAGVFAYLAAGGGAILLNELLSVLKAIPGLSSLWKSILDIISGALGGKPVAVVQAEKVEKIETKIAEGKV